MTGGGPGYATYTLPLYAFLKAYSAMEFGYGAALALILTVLLLLVVVRLCAACGRETSADDRTRCTVARRILEVEIPILVIVAFALAPYAWMMLTSIKPDERDRHGRFATCRARHLRALSTTCSQRTSFAGNLLNSLIVALGAVTRRSRRQRARGLRLLALSLLGPPLADDRSSWSSTCFPIVLLISRSSSLMRMLRPARHLFSAIIPGTRPSRSRSPSGC